MLSITCGSAIYFVATIGSPSRQPAKRPDYHDFVIINGCKWLARPEGMDPFLAGWVSPPSGLEE